MTAHLRCPTVLGAALAALTFSCARPAPVEVPAAERAGLGAVEGFVAAADGTPVAGIAVTLDAVGGGRELALTDNAGRYVFPELLPGAYDVVVDPCYGNHHARVTVEADAVARSDVRLGSADAAGGRALPSSADAPAGDLVANAGTPPLPLWTTHRPDDLAPAPQPAPPQTAPPTTLAELGFGPLEEQDAAGAPGLAEVLGAPGEAAPATPRLAHPSVEGARPLARERGLRGPAADELWVIARSPGSSSSASPAPRQRHIGAGSMCAHLPATQANSALPLRSTNIRADVVVDTATVSVTQEYHNPYKDKIEVIYLFPLPDNAAVSDFVMTIGKRRIRGIIRDHAEAREIYQQAREAGYRASLLTQERPNVFAQRIANVEPGRTIDVDLTYYHALAYREGGYDLVLPTVVGPRSGGGDLGAAPHGRATSQSSSSQPLTVPYLKAGDPRAPRVAVTVDIEAGVPLAGVASDTHTIDAIDLSGSRKIVTLSGGDAIANRDFALRYDVAGDAVESAYLVHDQGSARYFTVVIQPPAGAPPRSPLDLVIAIDRSDSMNGDPLRAAAAAARRLVGSLGPDDRFEIIAFSGKAERLAAAPLAATAANVARARDYLDGLDADGGADHVAALAAALSGDPADGRSRAVVVLTDGYIGDESEVLDELHDELGAARVFPIGVGTAVNRYLLERAAKIGRGGVAYIGLGGAADDAIVDEVAARLARPALAGVSLDFGDMKIADVVPARLPDVYQGRPVVVTGRVTGEVSDEVAIRGHTGGKATTVRVTRAANATRPGVARLWARRKLAELSDRAIFASSRASIEAEMRRLALRHGIASSLTAFVAVDASTRTKGAATPVHMPVAIPYKVPLDALSE